MPTAPTQAIRDEYPYLRSQAEVMLRVADVVAVSPLDTLRERLDGVLAFLMGTLVPRARAEERVLHPAIARLLGGSDSMVAMEREHQEIAWHSEQLAALRAQLDAEPLNAFRANELRRLLFGLYAMLRSHFAKEEEVYLPVLDTRSTPARISKLTDEMRRAVVEAQAAPLSSLALYLEARKAG